MIKKFLDSKSQNFLCTLVIGKKYFCNFKKFTFKYFYNYCKKNDIGIIAITDHLISKNSKNWKKPHWQKLIAPYLIKKKYKKIKNLCMIDSDILINEHSPNIFNFHKTNSISVVSVRYNMPYEWKNVTKKISFLRNRFYDKNYPLDSALHISLKDLYKFHNFKIQNDEFCAGLYVLSERYFKDFYDFFFKFDNNVKSITNGGEQTHFNYFVQKNYKINLLDYKFQALWIYEMSYYYPFLYFKKLRNKKTFIANCISASLMNNYFLHFAGSWYESEMWKNKKINSLFDRKLLDNYHKFKTKKMIGKPLGRIIP